jgi:hypothetical protein
MSYTQGKLSIKECGQGSEIVNEQGEDITEFLNGAFVDDDARRLVACWNACDGIPTKWIEGGAADILEHAVSLVKERDGLVAVIRSAQKSFEQGIKSDFSNILAKYQEAS